MHTRVAFIGLGVMGGPMAAHLARAGHQVHVFNRTREKADALAREHPVLVCASPKDAATDSDLVITCVGNDDDVRSVVLGNAGALAGMPPNSILIDHTTTSAELARELEHVCGLQDVSFLDAPISGGQVGAQNGTLTIMVGGDAKAFERADPILHAYARKTAWLGVSGSGQLCKMVNQICIAGLLQSLAEGLNFARAAGLDTETVVDVISKGAAQSWQMEHRHQSMLQDKFDFGFAVDWMRKDLGIAISEARKHGAALPVAQLVDQFYAELQAQGGGRWDTSSLIRRLSQAMPTRPSNT